MFKWLAVYICLFSYAKMPVNNNETKTKHPLYVTVTEINHNAKDKTLEVSCKIFSNDFEAAILKTFNKTVDLSSAKQKAENDKLIDEYINKHLQLKVDGKPVTLQFVGSEQESEATWCYLQVNNVPSVNKLIINNTLLYESFNNEINLMHVTVSGNRKSTKLNAPDAVAEFDF
ncbi:MAG: hypothetical protein JST87_06720 [Bacteroidetes bacterium]|nr:hypothetical protein [Bacteroidota bacterium]